MCHEAAEIIGVWMAPDGSKDKLIKELKTAAVNWGGNVRQENFPEKKNRQLYILISAQN